MHKESKQWKKILANKYTLLAFFVATFISGTLVVNFLLNFILNIPNYLALFKNYSVDNPVDPRSMLSAEWPLIIRWEYWFVYLIVYGFLGFFCSLKAYNLRRSFQDINKGTKGTARWTTLEEVREVYHAVKDNDEDYEGKSGIPVTHYEDELYIDPNNTNTLVVASTQSGKTEMFSYPLLDVIMRAEEKDSVIVTDIKGDMLKNTRGEFIKRGYDVHVLNLLNPYQSIGYNPLELIKQAYMKGEYSRAQMLCNTLSYSLFHNPNAKDPMWEESSIALVNALILAVCDISLTANKPENITMYTVTVMLSELGSNPDEDGQTKLDYFFGNLPANHPAKLQYATIQFSQGVTRGGIFTGTMAKLKNYAYDTIARMTATTTFHIEDLAFGEKPIALFIVYPDWDDSNYSIISTFLSQVAAVLSEKATLTKESKLPRRVRHLFEEVANIPAIEGLSRSLAVGLSRGLLYCLVIQNIAQIAEKYGDKAAKAITGNCGNQIYIMSDELEDAEEFSKKLGTKTVVSSDRSGQPLSLDKSFSEKEEERPLMMPDELRRLKKGEWVLVRTKKREDLDNERIEPFPIFSSLKAGTQMLHRYEYLMGRFNNPIAFDEMGLEAEHKSLDLNSLLIQFNTKYLEKEKPEKKTKPKNEAKTKKKDKESEESSEAVEKQEPPNNKAENKKKQEDIQPPVMVEVAATLIPEAEENFASEVILDYEERGEEDFMNQIEGVLDTSTPILEVITEDKYILIKAIVKKTLSGQEYAYFEGLKTIEEIETYFSSPEKQTLYQKVEQYFV
ncbi:type IV secretory system conjugative DNA transfer family protein [Fictibacillus sp. 7GRE50]|uniref:VirD4-like conjugal transfer protein, CD1115 family n=1 Tax=Fictibacillus sp. 7GRE50 TaxID=2745878 RepID=UPI0018CFA97B|nr:type IV secretory system conjugative DNA transfer family protein [Fictibacillus sp. 7GRE50]MBH0167131.1 type IV secretory system conjugative DNA transfer family protein [Fictibacillus sp. 7GRE50]